MKLLATFILLMMTCFTNAQEGNIQQSTSQDQLPYYEIPEHPAEYTATNVVARMLDGLGFRYYWVTEGLREEDLNYKPSESGRPSIETLHHIYGLVDMIYNSVTKQPTIRPMPETNMSIEQLRKKTLNLIKESSDILKAANPDELSNYKIIFKRGDNQSEFPFWNQLNGPIADALWHTGQIVSNRRASGNPYNSKASVFSGKVRK